MVNKKGKIDNIVVYKQDKAIKKGMRLAKKKPKSREEKGLSDKAIEDYIVSLKKAQPDKPQVAKVLLHWAELNKKYSEVSANKSAELDMKKFIKHGKK